MPHQTASDHDDKNDSSINFTPQITYTQSEIEAGNRLIEVLNDTSLSEAEKNSQCWDILNKK